jgi:[acyl-carrier-protein] S-malonyltransferase
MAPAEEELKAAIEKTTFYNPACPIYQNVVAQLCGIGMKLR